MSHMKPVYVHIYSPMSPCSPVNPPRSPNAILFLIGFSSMMLNSIPMIVRSKPAQRGP